MTRYSLLLKSDSLACAEQAFDFARSLVEQSSIAIEHIFFFSHAAALCHQHDWASLQVPLKLCVDSAIQNAIYDEALAAEYGGEVTLLPGFEISSLTQFFDGLMRCDQSVEFG
jgi:sulfur relay (sulfurtransferase) complex TusBCD TusD component (DsrE family)